MQFHLWLELEKTAIFLALLSDLEEKKCDFQVLQIIAQSLMFLVIKLSISLFDLCPVTSKEAIRHG